MTNPALMLTVYVSHPIKGKTADELDAIEALADRWMLERGFHPLLPRQIEPWRHDGPCPTGANGNGGMAGEAEHDHGCYLRGDLISMLVNADAILMMPGWEASNGARAEMQAALVVNMPVYFHPDALR